MNIFDTIRATAPELIGKPFTIADDGTVTGRSNLTVADQATLDDIMANFDAAAEALAAARADARQRVLRAVGAARGRFVTAADFQGSVYLAKAEEAQAVLAAIAASQAPDPAAYPHVEAEAAVTGTTLEAAAQDIVNKETLWLQGISPSIERLRRGAGLALDAVGDAATAEAIADQAATAAAQIVALADSATIADDVKAIVDALVWP